MGAVDTNPSEAQLHITDHGSDWLWAVFAIMAVSTLGMFAWSHMVSPHKGFAKLFSVLICDVASPRHPILSQYLINHTPCFDHLLLFHGI